MKLSYAKMTLCLLFLQIMGCSRNADIFSICEKGDVKALAKLLETDPSLIDCPKGVGKWTPLVYSVDSCQDQVTEYLISKGANVNYRTAYDMTALHFAAFRIDVHAVRLLLDAGAEVNIKSRTSEIQTPLDSAIQGGENLLRDRRIPPESIKNYVPKTAEQLRAEDEALQNVLELLKAHGAKRASELADENVN